MINNIGSWLKNNWVIALSVIWLVVGLVLLLVYLCLFKFVNWTVLSGFATWVLAGGIFLAFWQIREARKSTNAQIAVEMFKELRNYETVEKLRLIYNLKPEDIKDKTKEIDYVLDRLNMLGALVANGIVDKKLAIESYGGFSALRCWDRLCTDYIRIEQHDRGYYYENYEAFARLALEYFHKEGIEINLCGVDVVEKLWKNTLLQPRSLEEIKGKRKKKRTS